MDVIYLQGRMAVCLGRAEAAVNEDSRQAHRGMARFYADWIARLPRYEGNAGGENG